MLPTTGNPATFASKKSFGKQPARAGGETGHGHKKELIEVKTVVYHGSRQVPVDTRHDECLYAALRPKKPAADYQHVGKDLYVHMDRAKNPTWYLHVWSTSRATKEKILPISPQNAERFLRSKGLTCNLFPKNDPVATLYQWGYGIAEEF